MPFETGGASGKKNYLTLPKQGQSYDYSIHGKITAIEKVDNPDKKFGFNFNKKVPLLDGAGKPMEANGKVVMVDEDQGYFYRLTFNDGSIQTISSFSPFFALRDAGIVEGDMFKLDHPDKGEWVVTKA